MRAPTYEAWEHTPIQGNRRAPEGLFVYPATQSRFDSVKEQHMHSKQEHIPKGPLAFGLFLTKPFWFMTALSFVFVIIAQSLETSTYYIFKQIIDTAGMFASGAEAASAVLVWVVLYPIAAIGHSLVYRASGLSAMQWITRAQKYGRDALFRYLSLHSPAYFSNRFAGALSNKVWNATDGVGNLAENALWSYTNLGVAFIGSVLLVYLAHPILAGIFAFFVAVLLVISVSLAKRNRRLSTERTLERSKLTGLLVDIVTNMPAVRQFARRDVEIARVEKGSRALQRAALRAWLGGEIMLIVGNVVMGLFMISMLVASFGLWKDGSITTGSFVMILTLMASLTGWFSFIGNSMNSFAREYGSIKEGLEEILVPHDLSDFPKAKALAVPDGAIMFDRVSFMYGTRTVFKDLSLAIPAGQRVGVVGSSGSGKTTLVSLLLRQEDVHEGSVKIDGQNIRKVTLLSLNEAIAVVPQDPSLFHRTLKENIAYGNPNATDEEIIAAAAQAQAHEFIMAAQGGYDTLVGERGVKLSGGQRQRVAIARAILKAAPILVLDEATSSLDSESEVEIQKALQALMAGKTVIAIAHRLSTIKEMDRIIVLDGGNIVQDGTHEELLKEGNGVYARLWNHQAGGFLQDDESA